MAPAKPPTKPPTKRETVRATLWREATNHARGAGRWSYADETLSANLWTLWGIDMGASVVGVDPECPKHNVGAAGTDFLFMAACFVVAVEAMQSKGGAS
jgi:hypothetical protein